MKKKEREAIEDALMEEELAEARKRTISKFFVTFSKQHVAFLKDLVVKYKEAGEYPLHPMLVLPSYYTDNRDREIAVFAALLLHDRCRFENIYKFREMLGDHPWQWFLERGFVRLSLGNMQNKRTAGVDNWRIAGMFDAIYQERQYAIQMTRDDDPWLYDAFFNVVIMRMCTFASSVSCVVNEYLYGNVERKIRSLLFVLGRSDGFSLGLWPIPQVEVKCPVTGEINRFMKTWFPNYSLAGGIDYAIDLFGFNSAGDFYYAFLAWKRLCMKDPKGCSRYATIYQKWYSEGNIQMPHKWKLVQPKFNKFV